MKYLVHRCMAIPLVANATIHVHPHSGFINISCILGYVLPDQTSWKIEKCDDNGNWPLVENCAGIIFIVLKILYSTFCLRSVSQIGTCMLCSLPANIYLGYTFICYR